MTQDRDKAERAIAFLVSQIRPDWNEPGVVSELRKCSERPLAQVAAAALHCAELRTDQRTPAVIALDGAHWQALDRMAGRDSSTNGPDLGPWCNVCGRTETACKLANSKVAEDQRHTFTLDERKRTNGTPGPVAELTKAMP